MRKFRALAQIQMRDFASRYTQQVNAKGKVLSRLAMLLPLLLILPIVQIVGALDSGFVAMGHGEFTVTYTYIVAVTMVFFSCIPLILSVFFFSKDLSFISTLPVSERTVVFSKLAVVYVYSAVISAITLGVGVGFYGIKGGGSAPALVLGILGILLTPIIPMGVATLVILPLMKQVGGKKNRNGIIILGNIIFIGAIVVLQILASRAMVNPEAIQQYLGSEDGLLNLIGSIFPPSIWLTQMVMGQWISVLLYVLLNAAVLFVLALLAKRLYKGAMRTYNQAVNTGGGGTIRYRARGRRALLLRRHMGIIFHNPTFLMQTVMTLFIPLLLFIIYSAMGIMNVGQFQNDMLRPFMPYIFAGILAMPTVMGSLTATAISREGKYFWETRALPISTRDDFWARIATTVVLSAVSMVVLTVLCILFLPLKPLDVVMGLLVTISALICFAGIDLIINIQRPYIHWTSPTAAVKNNLNILLSFIPRLVYIGIGFVIFKALAPMGALVFLAAMTLVFLISTAGVYYLLFHRYAEVYRRIDV